MHYVGVWGDEWWERVYVAADLGLSLEGLDDAAAAKAAERSINISFSREDAVPS